MAVACAPSGAAPRHSFIGKGLDAAALSSNVHLARLFPLQNQRLYDGSLDRSTAPHIYAISDAATYYMLNTQKSQCCIVRYAAAAFPQSSGCVWIGWATRARLGKKRDVQALVRGPS